MRARRASGGREGELLKRAGKLRASVDPLLPELTEGADEAPFEKLRRALERVREIRDDEKQLDRVSRWEDPIVRAYAGLLKFYLEPELPGVLVAPFPGGEISFAPLGGAPREAQIAVQQSDDPKRLMIGYLTWARKGFHFFATPERLYCTGRDPNPPKSFLHSQLESLPYRLSAGPGGVYECVHLQRKEPVRYLQVAWPDAHRTYRVCRSCAKPDRQLLGAVTQGLAVPDPEGSFPFEAALNVDCQGGRDCVHQSLPSLSRSLRKGYLFGRLSDAELLDQYRAELVPRLQRVGTPTYVAAGRCFGGDRAAFLAALSPNEVERQALDRALPSISGLFEIDEATASRALEKLWPAHAETIVAAIVPDAAEARRLVQEARASPGRVSELLSRAARATQERRVLANLPSYASLRPEAAFVDGVARMYRVQGSSAAERFLLQSIPREGKERGLAFGLLKALGVERPHVWQFTDTERQFGESLATQASRLLNDPPESYDSALGSLLAAAGVADWGTRTHD